MIVERNFLQTRTKKSVHLTRIQELIGRRMLQSKRTKPCFYLTATADITKLMSLRPKLRKSFGIKITTNTFYIRAIGLAAKKFPLMVGTLAGNKINIAEHINVSFAVNAPQGLMVPVLKDVDKKPLEQIAKQEKQLIERARDNQLTMEDIEDQTIALSNLGAYDIDSFIAIVPPPVSTIVAVGNIIRKPVLENDQMAMRKTITISIAADHRVINGYYAARFLEYLTDQLSHPLKTHDFQV